MQSDAESWFVSTAKRAPGEQHFEPIWTMVEFETEAAARRYAEGALNNGLRVEAGTIPGPQVLIPWRQAASWVASGEAGPRSQPFGESRRWGSAGARRLGDARWLLS